MCILNNLLCGESKKKEKEKKETCIYSNTIFMELLYSRFNATKSIIEIKTDIID